jgi:proline iminopeptidase
MTFSETEQFVTLAAGRLWSVATGSGIPLVLFNGGPGCDDYLGVIGIAGGKIVDDRHWSETYHSRLKSVGEDNGGKQFDADPDVNRQGNATWREYCRRPDLLRDLSALEVPCVFINAGEDIRPNWPTQQLAGLIPRARYVEIPDAAHCVWLTHSPELLRGNFTALSPTS